MTSFPDLPVHQEVEVATEVREKIKLTFDKGPVKAPSLRIILRHPSKARQNKPGIVYNKDTRE